MALKYSHVKKLAASLSDSEKNNIVLCFKLAASSFCGRVVFVLFSLSCSASVWLVNLLVFPYWDSVSQYSPYLLANINFHCGIMMYYLYSSVEEDGCPSDNAPEILQEENCFC